MTGADAQKIKGLSALVITKNEAQNVDRCLDALGFCEEVVVLDSGSTDGTVERARERGARIVERRFTSYADQKDYGRTVARHPWVLAVDADEVVSAELASEIAARIESGIPDRIAAFEVPFRNRFRGVWIRHAGYYPDRHIRLFRRDRCRYDPERPVHERLICEGSVEVLSGHVDHHTFESIARFVEKSACYSDVWARSQHARGQRAGVLTILSHTLGRFVRAYVLRRGFLDGSLGLVMSGLQAAEVFQKYARLWELSAFAVSEANLPAGRMHSDRAPRIPERSEREDGGA